jgi:hypothetical protein
VQAHVELLDVGHFDGHVIRWLGALQTASANGGIGSARADASALASR